MTDDRAQKESRPDVRSFYEGIVYGNQHKHDKNSFLYAVLGYILGRRR